MAEMSQYTEENLIQEFVALDSEVFDLVVKMFNHFGPKYIVGVIATAKAVKGYKPPVRGCVCE